MKFTYVTSFDGYTVENLFSAIFRSIEKGIKICNQLANYIVCASIKILITYININIDIGYINNIYTKALKGLKIVLRYDFGRLRTIRMLLTD